MTNNTETVVMHYNSADEFVDNIIAAMEQDPEMERIHIDMTDKVLRPFLALLDTAQSNKVNPHDVEAALAGTFATAMLNIIGRTVPNDNLDVAVDKAQVMIEYTAQVVSESITNSYTMAEEAPTRPH